MNTQQMQQYLQQAQALGRNGDTILAHITPQEAFHLKAMGGSGTINPYTGLPEFFLGGIGKAIGGAVRSVGRLAGAGVRAVNRAVGGIGNVLKKAAPILIPLVIAVAAPMATAAIAKWMAASSGTLMSSVGTWMATSGWGATLGSALTGAGMGALGAAATGQDIGQGALMGGITGGIAGFASGPTGLEGSAGTAGTTGAAQTGAAPQAGLTTSTAPTVTGTSGTFATTGGVNVAAQSTTPSLLGSAANFAKSVGGELLNRVSDPAVAADFTMRAAALIAGNAGAGEGLTPQEQELLNLQKQELERMRQQDEALFQQRLQTATDLLGEARYFDPEYFGLRAQADVQLQAAQQRREAERDAALQGGRQGLTASEARRAGLDTTAAAQSAYLRGADAAQQQRMNAYQQGLAALPTASPNTVMQYSPRIQAQYAEAEKRKNEAAAGIGDLFGSFYGDMTKRRDEEQKKEQKKEQTANA